MKSKSIFKSKLAMGSAIVAVVGALGSFFPDVERVVKENANIINMVVGILGFAIRKITHEKVVFWDSSDNDPK